MTPATLAIDHTDKPAFVVASELGFADPAYFALALRALRAAAERDRHHLCP
jgi:hypothetical protein